MRLEIVAVRDRAIDSFGRPVFIVSLGAAVRSFIDQINDASTEFAKHPEDYDLYHLGSFDDGDGRFFQLEKPVQISIGKQVVIKGS
jgi:hypothetical protein